MPVIAFDPGRPQLVDASQYHLGVDGVVSPATRAAAWAAPVRR